MGYNTNYTLSMVAGNSINKSEVEEQLKEISGVPIKIGWNNACKWYCHEYNMKSLSKIYPETLFLLEGEGEESEDIWQKYFKNGKMQVCKAEIVFPKFDESLME